MLCYVILHYMILCYLMSYGILFHYLLFCYVVLCYGALHIAVGRHGPKTLFRAWKHQVFWAYLGYASLRNLCDRGSLFRGVKTKSLVVVTRVMLKRWGSGLREE